MNAKQYKLAVTEVFQIEAQLMQPAHRKDTRLILRHMELCGQIHAYSAERERRQLRKRVAA
jgi:hypothetical protein